MITWETQRKGQDGKNSVPTLLAGLFLIFLSRPATS